MLGAGWREWGTWCLALSSVSGPKVKDVCNYTKFQEPSETFQKNREALKLSRHRLVMLHPAASVACVKPLGKSSWGRGTTLPTFCPVRRRLATIPAPHMSTSIGCGHQADTRGEIQLCESTVLSQTSCLSPLLKTLNETVSSSSLAYSLSF